MTYAPTHHRPLARNNSTGETAQRAAEFMARHGRDRHLRQLVLDMIEERPGTGEEVLARLRDRGIQCVLYSVKPRFTELQRDGLVVDSGERGVSESGRLRSVRWRATSAAERAAFQASKAEAASAAETGGGRRHVAALPEVDGVTVRVCWVRGRVDLRAYRDHCGRPKRIGTVDVAVSNIGALIEALRAAQEMARGSDE